MGVRAAVGIVVAAQACLAGNVAVVVILHRHRRRAASGDAGQTVQAVISERLLLTDHARTGEQVARDGVMAEGQLADGAVPAAHRVRCREAFAVAVDCPRH